MEELIFVQLEQGQELVINNCRITSELPLPMLQTELEKLVKDKEIPWPAFVRGIIYLLAKEPNNAHVDEYKKLLYDFNPQIEALLIGEGTHLAAEGQLEVAQVIFQGLANLNPELTEAWFNLGLCCQELSTRSLPEKAEQARHYLDKAIESFEYLVGLDKASPILYYNLGFLYRQKGQLDQAKAAWEQAVKQGIDEKRKQELADLILELDRLDIVEVQISSGINAISQGNFREAVILLQPLAKRYPNWWQIAFNLGVAYCNLGEFIKAKEMLIKAVAINPLPDVYSQLGLCYFSLGQKGQAEDALEKAVSLNAEDPGLQSNLGYVYLRQNRFTKAADVLYRARELAPEDSLIKQYISELPAKFQR